MGKIEQISLLCLTFVGSIMGQYFICPRGFFGQITTKNLSLCSWEITKKSFCLKWLKIFHFSTLWIWLFWIFDKCPQWSDEVKNSMGLLQGPRLMAWTTKSPIRENHWVPWGCRALLGSVKLYFNEKTNNFFWIAGFFSPGIKAPVFSGLFLPLRL